MNLLRKLAGLGLVLFGIFSLVHFPGISKRSSSKYQPEEMSKAGILIGLLSFFLGIYLMKS